MRQIILDTETTGLDPNSGHRIIEIGCVEMVNRRLTGKFFHQYCNPKREIDKGALAVHGISNEFLKNKPVFEDIVEDFLTFLADAELIIHNAPFDLGFIHQELSLCKRVLQAPFAVIDTLALARKMHPGQKNNLDALCKRYSVDNTKRDLHGALLDAKILAQVYLAMTSGQTTLFEDNMIAATDVQQQVNVATNTAKEATPIIYATAEENLAHENYFAAQKKG